MRKLVARQAAPVTLKSAFLEPLSRDMPTQLALDLFAMTDSEFMQMFTGGSALCVPWCQPSMSSFCNIQALLCCM